MAGRIGLWSVQFSYRSVLAQMAFKARRKAEVIWNRGCVCCNDHNLFFQPTERLCWIEFCHHIKHRSKWSHHSLQVRETQFFLSSFSKHSWNEPSSFLVEWQQSTPGRCSHCWLSSCFIPPELPRLLNKDLSLLAVCMYYEADLLRGHRKGLFCG